MQGLPRVTGSPPFNILWEFIAAFGQEKRPEYISPDGRKSEGSVRFVDSLVSMKAQPL
jgi:hypothetical protein